MSLWRGSFLGAVEEGRCVTPANDGKSNDYGMSMLLYDLRVVSLRGGCLARRGTDGSSTGQSTRL
ncbi:hypothetical protein [Bacteroides stercorirosoris]|uniref:hypothetical protein n=1 Tax=Bacteroides stercorirosoris TaxID=871324 RepID=UPI0011C1CFC6|nr:hypothetical protein [Bacteroides stercorirosoris]